MDILHYSYDTGWRWLFCVAARMKINREAPFPTLTELYTWPILNTSKVLTISLIPKLLTQFWLYRNQTNR